MYPTNPGHPVEAEGACLKRLALGLVLAAGIATGGWDGLHEGPEGRSAGSELLLLRRLPGLLERHCSGGIQLPPYLTGEVLPQACEAPVRGRTGAGGQLVAHDPLEGLAALEGTASPSDASSLLRQSQVASDDHGGLEPQTEPPRGVRTSARTTNGLRQAIDYWCAAYQVSCADMHSIAECESTYGRDPNAYNGSSGFWGAFQFHLSTWLSTPPGQRGELATDDWAAAEGAAWMLLVGRRGEWPSC